MAHDDARAHKGDESMPAALNTANEENLQPVWRALHRLRICQTVQYSQPTWSAVWRRATCSRRIFFSLNKEGRC